MALRNRQAGVLKTGYSNKGFQTPHRGDNRDLSPLHHSGIEVRPQTTTHAPEIVFNSLYTDRNQTQRSKHVIDDSVIKANHKAFMHTRGRSSIDFQTLEPIKEEIPVGLTGCDYATTEHLFCRLITCLIQNDARLLKAKGDFLDIKFDVEKRLNLSSKFSPVSMFQRLDRAGKGHVTRTEMLNFLADNGFKEGEGFVAKDLSLIMKSKMDY